MREFKSLNPQKLSDSYNAELYGEEPIVKIDESEHHISITYIFPGFYVIEDSVTEKQSNKKYYQIDIDGAGHINENGKPALPSFGRYVQIPLGCDYNIKITKSQPTNFDNILVKPAQSLLTDTPYEKEEFQIDKPTYESNEIFPAESVIISEPIIIDGYSALLIHVNPIQYNPLEKKLTCYEQINVNIDLTEKKVDTDEYPLLDPENNLEGFGNLFLNPGRNLEERLSVKLLNPKIPARILRSGPELIIIYYKTFKSAAEKLSKWKNKKGIPCNTVSIDYVSNYNNSTTDEDKVLALKTYIRNAKKPKVIGGKFVIPRLRHIILFGDVDTIVSETISNDAVSGGNWGPVNISDYYYSTSKDPATNTEMVFPWISIGRIPVRNSHEGLTVVNKIIQYEKNPPCDPDYYKRFTFAALFQDSSRDDPHGDGRASRAYMRTMEEIRQRMISLDFDVTRVYVKDRPNVEMEYYSNGTPVPQDVKDAIVDEQTATEMLISETSEGQLLIAHRDHGLQDGWHLPSFTRQHVTSITSNNLSIFLSLNCQTGWFDRPSNIESFAETMLRINGGAPSLIAATRNSSTTLNDNLMKALFDGIWSGILPTFPSATTASYPIKNNRLGDILNYGKSYLPIASNNNTYNKDHFEIYHVLGDPSIEIWKEEPKAISIRAKATVLNKKPTLTITLNHCPAGCVLTIMNKNHVIKRIEPKSTQITLSLKEWVHPTLPSPTITVKPKISICFSAPGYRYREIKVSV